MTNGTIISSHYEAHSADSYEKAYFSEPGTYMQHLVDLVGTQLKLGDASPPCRLMDIGGNFAQALIDRHPSKFDVTVVDPFLDPTTSSKQAKGLKFVKESAEALIVESSTGDDGTTKDWRKVGYHKVLLKEAAHHFPASDRVGIFKGIYDSLVVEEMTTVNENVDSNIIPGATTTTTKSTAAPAQFLLVTRPQLEIDYPLWDEARQIWKENQPKVPLILYKNWNKLGL